MVRYVIRSRADRDVDEIAEYLAEAAGLDTALQFMAKIYATFDLLAERQQIGWRTASRGEWIEGNTSLVVAGTRSPFPQGTISCQSFAVMNWERCFAFVVATMTSTGAGPNESAWAARMTSTSRSFASAVGRPC